MLGGEDMPGSPKAKRCRRDRLGRGGRLFLIGVAAAGVVLGVSVPASAQYPGTNGLVTYIVDGTDSTVPCMGLYYGDGPFDRFVEEITWAPDGKQVAQTVSPRSPGSDRLIVFDTSTCSIPRDLGPVDFRSTTSWSPDGTQIAVQRGGDIWILKTSTGAVVRNLTPNLPSTIESHPSWSPKNTGIAYRASDGIRIRPVTGGASRLWKANVDQPDWSPDGSKIAYLAGRSSYPNTALSRIAYANASTGGSVVTTAITADQFTWSPDGKYFFFRGIYGNCVVATIAGKITFRPPGGEENCWAPSWQPKH